jgi:hypothetical protein
MFGIDLLSEQISVIRSGRFIRAGGRSRPLII